jgi:hypothetical protein
VALRGHVYTGSKEAEIKERDMALLVGTVIALFFLGVLMATG